MKNKGMSLIEVVVSLAILSIVVVMVMSFMVLGMNTSTASTNDSGIQKEAQTVANQVEGWIMGANKGIDIFNATTYYDQAAAIYYDGEEENERYVQVIFYRKEDRALYYKKIAVTSTFTGSEAQIEKQAAAIDSANGWEDCILSEYVDSFSLDLSDMSNQKVGLDITYALKDRQFHVSNVIHLRNVPSDTPSDYSK